MTNTTKKLQYFVFSDTVLVEYSWQDIVKDSNTGHSGVTETVGGKRYLQFNSLDNIVLVTKDEPVVSYSLRTEHSTLPKTLTEETYESLSKTFKMQYEKKTFRSDIETPLSESDVYEEGFVTSKTFAESLEGSAVDHPYVKTFMEGLHRKFYIENVIQSLMGVISAQRNPRVIVESSWQSVTVNFLENDYDGKTRRIYETKRNGQRYADGRGKNVKDFTAIDTVVFKLPYKSKNKWFISDTLEEAVAKLEAAANKITLTESKKD